MTIEEINEERFELLHKKFSSGLTEEEQLRLDEVTEKMREHVRPFQEQMSKALMDELKRIQERERQGDQIMKDLGLDTD